MFLPQRPAVKTSVSLRLARAGGYMRIGSGSLGEASDSQRGQRGHGGHGDSWRSLLRLDLELRRGRRADWGGGGRGEPLVLRNLSRHFSILSRSCGCGSKVRLRLSEAYRLRQLGDAEVSQQSRAIAGVAGAGVGPGVAQDLGLGARSRGRWVSLGP